jgi:hypothetical protein
MYYENHAPEDTSVNVEELKSASFKLFYMLIDLIVFRSAVVWHYKDIRRNHESELDVHYFIQICETAYKKIVEIQSELFLLSGFVVDDNSIKILADCRYNHKIASNDIQPLVDLYNRLNMGSEIRRIVYQLVKLNKGLENLKLFGLNTMSLTTPTPDDYITEGISEIEQGRPQQQLAQKPTQPIPPQEEEPKPAGPPARKAIRENYDHTLDHMFDLGETRTVDQIAYTKIAYPISTDIVSFHGHKIMGKRVITTDSKDMGKVIKISPHLVFIKKKDKENLPNDMNNIHYIQRGFFKYFDKDSLYTLISRKQFEEISERNKQTYREKYEKDSDIEQISSSSSQSKSEDSSKVTSTSSHSS